MQSYVVIEDNVDASLSCDRMIRPTKQDTQLGVILQKNIAWYCGSLN